MPAFHYSLIYIERPYRSDAMVRLNGPTLHASVAEARSTLWAYVADEIIEKAMGEFIEFACDQGLAGFDDEEEPPEGSEAQRLIDLVQEEDQPAVIRWYFELMRDDCTEAAFRITRHAASNGSGSEPAAWELHCVDEEDVS